MQACGPVVRPHEILQTLIISIPQPSAAVKSFFELSRNFGAPEAIVAVTHGRRCRCSPAGTRGDRTPYGFLSPLDSPYLPLRCDSLRSRSEMRGAHRDVWCSKSTPLMEAELFAAERGRPAPSGRALLCAANHASEIQGSSAAYMLKDARNRVPVLPRLDARPKGVASKGK